MSPRRLAAPVAAALLAAALAAPYAAAAAKPAAARPGVAAASIAVEPVTPPGPPLALTGGTVHTVSGGVIERGTVVVQGAKITAVGADVPVPAGAQVVDCTGRQVYPGFVAANTMLGLIEVESVEGSNDTQETGNLNPNIRAEVMFNPDSDLLPVTRLNGVTSALVIPGGGALRGTSAVMHLDGWTREDMTLEAPAGLHVEWPNMTPIHAWFETRSDEEQAKARDQAVDAIRDAFDDARAYWKAREAEGKPGVPGHDADAKWDAMRRALAGQIPVMFHCQRLNQIQAVLKFVDEQHLPNVILVGGYDAWRVADELKRRNIAVIVAGALGMPERTADPYDAAFALPARLAAAGVRYCIADQGGGFSASNARNLPHHAAMAEAFGLPADEALKSVTLYPAQILGLGDRIGSIEAGKLADLQITDGDPLMESTHCLQVILNGRVLPMESRQTRLFEKYDHRPRGAHARPR